MEEMVKVKQVQVGPTTLLQVMEQDLVLDLQAMVEEVVEDKVKVNQDQVALAMLDLQAMTEEVMEDKIKVNLVQVEAEKREGAKEISKLNILESKDKKEVEVLVEEEVKVVKGEEKLNLKILEMFLRPARLKINSF